jgi:predicted transcriptional regulator of viral defense system
MEIPKNFSEKHDVSTMDRLYALGEAQCGLLTAAQAIAAGIARSSLEYHARPRGQLERRMRGLYRLRRFPISERDHLWEAYLPLAPAGAVVSHVSALTLLGLCDLTPDAVHLTLPRSERWRIAPRGARLHFAIAPLAGSQIVRIDGLPAAAPVVALPATVRQLGMNGHMELAVRRSIGRGMVTHRQLRSDWPPALLPVLDRLTGRPRNDSRRPGRTS